MLTSLETPNSEQLAIIEITNLCEAFGVLPGPGGLLDQPAELIVKMEMVLLVRSEKLERETEKAKAKSGARNKRT